MAINIEPQQLFSDTSKNRDPEALFPGDPADCSDGKLSQDVFLGPKSKEEPAFDHSIKPDLSYPKVEDMQNTVGDWADLSEVQSEKPAEDAALESGPVNNLITTSNLSKGHYTHR